MIVKNHLSLLYIKDTIELVHPELDIFLHTYETFLALYEKMLIIDHISIPEIQQSWTQPKISVSHP